MKSNYRYQEIQDAYNKNKNIVEDNIGLDFHEFKFTKPLDSIDLKIIDIELERMFNAGKEAAEIYPNRNIFKTIKKIITIPNYMQKVATLTDYANGLKPEPVNRYAIEIFHPQDRETIQLDAKTVVEDMHNAFNNGLLSIYMNKPKSFFCMFSDKRVIKPE